MDKLLGKSAIVTGASRGIGRDIAIKLSENGALVIVNYSKDEEGASETCNIIKEKGGFALKFKADVSNFDEAKELVDFAVNNTGRLDIVVNNAGISNIGLFMDSTKEDIKNLMGINLFGTLYVTKHALGHMLSRGGNIVNISSMWGEVGASCEVLYSSSKGGINLFTKALAKEMAPSNIRVNAIAPGVIDTSMNAFLTEEDRKDLEEEIPIGRFGKGEEIANAVVFLCSDESSYLTGQVIRIDGGMI
ncbi:short-chain dehydrogenase [Clostridium baratii]|uniref:elongation factor P 5-aminopentanone reductase n=1 Tax=Clostridium baratii TaxID=1561 RepID=UPI0009A35607|nr:SDR family oxidoreductase [Clostridium baratii]OPF52027.1 short-chain dehydrogenase [Clostridium baratii]OPF53651.1 short-chain dehydrogenase [Clostridium baratii]OPF57759.1 short-chain dehydrogenase [Clostridium baratii]OPF60745.1 short-chain dehydrogenase [Clostridium baratii]